MDQQVAGAGSRYRQVAAEQLVVRYEEILDQVVGDAGWFGVARSLGRRSVNLVRLSDMDLKSIRTPDRTTQLGIRWWREMRIGQIAHPKNQAKRQASGDRLQLQI
jgi:hypothetical protein